MPEQHRRAGRRPRWTFEDGVKATADAIRALALVRDDAQWAIEDLLSYYQRQGSTGRLHPTDPGPKRTETPVPRFTGTAEQERRQVAWACIRYAPLDAGHELIMQAIRDVYHRAQQRARNQPEPGEETMQQDESERTGQEARAREAAYRRGLAQGTEEAARLVLQMIESGYQPTEIRRLLAVYDDHFLAAWRVGDLDEQEAPPAFDINRCQEILQQTTGYDWIM